jgi:hypothetical protein
MPRPWSHGAQEDTPLDVTMILGTPAARGWGAGGDMRVVQRAVAPAEAWRTGALLQSAFARTAPTRRESPLRPRSARCAAETGLALGRAARPGALLRIALDGLNRHPRTVPRINVASNPGLRFGHALKRDVVILDQEHERNAIVAAPSRPRGSGAAVGTASPCASSARDASCAARSV